MNQEDSQHDMIRHHQRRARRPSGSRPLARARHQRIIAGVAGGIASFVDTRPATVRWLFVLTTPLTGGISGIGYLLLWLLLPLEEASG